MFTKHFSAVSFKLQLPNLNPKHTISLQVSFQFLLPKKVTHAALQVP